MKQIARLMFIAVLFATLSLPALAAERGDEAPTFYGYNIDSCKAIASGIGEVTATFLYYWDIEAEENRVANIEHVDSDLTPGYYSRVVKGRKSVTVVILATYGTLQAISKCNV